MDIFQKEKIPGALPWLHPADGCLQQTRTVIIWWCLKGTGYRASQEKEGVWGAGGRGLFAVCGIRRQALKNMFCKIALQNPLQAKNKNVTIIKTILSSCKRRGIRHEEATIKDVGQRSRESHCPRYPNTMNGSSLVTEETRGRR